jgi:hypothetical protein
MNGNTDIMSGPFMARSKEDKISDPVRDVQPTQPIELVVAATGAWLAAVVGTGSFDVSMAPITSRHSSMQALNRVCNIRVSNFMAVLLE